MNVSNLISLVILRTALPSLIYSQTNNLPDIEKLENYLEAIHLSMGFNGEILVPKDEDIHFQKAIGLASFDLTFLQEDDLVIGLKAERMGKTFEFKKDAQ